MQILFKKNQLKNVCPKRKIVYIHIPKTGGSSIESLLFGRKETSEHLPASSYAMLENYFSFSFVRNPYLRAISIYNYYKRGGNGTSDQALDCGLEDFFINYSDDNFRALKSQTAYINKAVDFIGRFESFQEDLAFILNKFNLEKEVIWDRKREYGNYTVSPELIELLSKIYHDDFLNFNYNKIKLKYSVSYVDFLALCMA